MRQFSLENRSRSIDRSCIEVLWIGNEVTTDINYDYHFNTGEDAEEAVQMLTAIFQEKGILFKGW